MSQYDESAFEGAQRITQRRLEFCEYLSFAYTTDELIRKCDECHCFYATCCSHSACGHNDTVCHHWRLVFTDGACSNNGRGDARAGIGIAIGDRRTLQWSMPIDDSLDPGAKPTSQRAELVAALEGVRKMAKLDKECYGLSHGDSDEDEDEASGTKIWIVTTDSEYVVKGMTDWLPKWRVRLGYFYRRYLSYPSL